jgi:hypothetical protein
MVRWEGGILVNGNRFISCVTVAVSVLLVIGTAPPLRSEERSQGRAEGRSRWRLELESGIVFSGYNDVRIPNETGTDISLTDDLETDPAPFVRVRVTAVFGDRHVLSALAAPLRLDATGSVDRAVNFEGVEFPAGAPLHARYRFDSYRLTYRYVLHKSERVAAGLGFTAKIRDAAVRITGAGEESEKPNTGFVPLINFSVRWSFARHVSLLFEGDALAAPQGRAEDVLAAFRYDRGRIGLMLGYRLLEGGADVDEVYNFALLHYLVAGAGIQF